MNNADFWKSVSDIIAEGFTPEGLHILDYYAELFISGRIVYQRFSPLEQRGCAAGGETHVIASLLAGAEDCSDTDVEETLSEFKRERQRGAKQESAIEQWAEASGCWVENVTNSLARSFGEEIAEGGEAVVFDHGATIIKSIGLDYFVLPILALDRITLHNAYFPETKLKVLGFGRDQRGEFKIIVEQPFIGGSHVSDEDIAMFMTQMGFELKNPRNWTYATTSIYLSDMHDENVIRSETGAICVVDCDIRINTPELRSGGIRTLTTSVVFDE
jgi:hypothetical protein